LPVGLWQGLHMREVRDTIREYCRMVSWEKQMEMALFDEIDLSSHFKSNHFHRN
jgi:hypothetical protein